MHIKDLKPKTTAKHMNKIMESRFGFAIDFDKLDLRRARKINSLVNESMAMIKRNHGLHEAERNPRYMELLMLKESMNRWLVDSDYITESEIGRSEAILAAKDMVDSLQDMVEKLSKMQVEQLPALIDTIRNQIGSNEADSFKNSMTQLLSDVVQSLGQARETADNNARQLAGEPTSDAGSPTDSSFKNQFEPQNQTDTGIEPQTPVPTGQGFDASDAAAGGQLSVGRSKRP